MEIKCFHAFQQVSPFRAELDALNRASRQRDPFSTLAFLENFNRHDQYYPGDSDAEPWFLIAFEKDQPVGYLAMRRIVERVFGLPSPKLEFFATHDVNCPHVVARPEDEARCSEAFYSYLLSRAKEWSFLEFHQQDEDSTLTPAPEGPDLRKYLQRTFPTLENNTVPIRWTQLGDYFKSMSSHFRTDVRKDLRTLREAGEVTYVSSMDALATPVLLELLQTVEVRSWRSEQGCAIWGHEDRLDYYRGLLAPEQPMRPYLGVVLLDGVPIAGGIYGDYERIFYSMVVMFDAGYRKLGPGTTLMMMAMHQAITGGYEAFNMLSGFSYYKKRWMAEPTPTVSGQIFRVGRPRYWKLKLGDLKRRLTKAPPTPQAQDFNPVRRESTAAINGPLTAVERTRVTGLLKQLRGLPARWLGPEDLAALMPFAAPVPVKGGKAKAR